MLNSGVLSQSSKKNKKKLIKKQKIRKTTFSNMEAKMRKEKMARAEAKRKLELNAMALRFRSRSF
jgi:hypothetical protein